MFSIVNIIYGVPLTEEIYKKIGEWEETDDERWWEDDRGGPCGFQTFYSGSSEFPPGFCGACLGSFDEVCPNIQLKGTQILIRDNLKEKYKINLEPDEVFKQKVYQKINNLDPELKEMISEIGIYFIFSTS